MQEARLAYSATDLHAAIPVADGMRAGISLLAAGDMALSKRGVLPWRGRFCSRLGLDPARLYGARQVHSRRAIVVEDATPGQVAEQEADALVCAPGDAALSVTVADCLPAFFVDRSSGAFAIAHSGWRGTGIVLEVIAAMRERFGTAARDLGVTLGPCIGPCCYRVPRERAEAFSAEFGARSVVRDGSGAPRLDLRAANAALLDRAGVQDVTVVTDCTCCSPSLGSFRRQGPESYSLMLAFLCRAAPGAPGRTVQGDGGAAASPPDGE